MNRWMLFPVLASLLALALSHGFMHAPFVSNDGTQYIDAAEHLLAGGCLCTTVAHFDEQLSAGRVPVPFTHFAPGYPILIAGLASVGIAPESAGYLISALAFVVTLWLMWDIGLRLGVGPFAMLLVSLLWLTNDLALAYAAGVLADMPFTAFLCGTVALVARDIQTNSVSRFLPFAIGITAAITYWMKYAGLFVITTAILYLVWRAWRSRESRFWSVGEIAAAVLVAAPIPIHNILYQGSWRGGFQNGKRHSVRFVVTETAKAFYHMLFGANASARLDAWAIIAILSLIALVILIFKNRRGFLFSVELIWIVLFVAAFTSGVAVASMQSIASDLLRYDFPVYPLLLVVGAALFMPSRPAEFVAFSSLVLAVLLIQSRSLVSPMVSPPEGLKIILNQQVQSGVSMRQWLESHVQTADVIVAPDGQALHYILKTPVVSIIEPVYSDRPTDEAAFQSLMRQFHARYLVVYPNWVPGIVPEQEAVPFLRNLSSGMGSPPSWLTVAARTKNVEVFECATCR